MNGLLSGLGAVRIDGGVVELTNTANSFTGGIRIGNSGILQLSDVPDNSATSTLGASGPITFGLGQLRFTGTGSDSSNRPLVFENDSFGNSAATIEVGAAATLTLSAASGPGGFTKAGAGTLVMTEPASTFTGPVKIFGGVLRTGPLENTGVSSALGAGNSINLLNGAQLILPAGVNGATNRSLSGTGKIGISNSTITLNGSITADLTFVGNDPGTDIVVLSALYPLQPSSGAPLNTSKTTLDRVKVRVIGGDGLAPHGRVELLENTGSLLDILIPVTIGSLQGGGGSNPGKVNIGARLTVGNDNSNATFAGIIEGSGGLWVTGTGTTSLTGTNSFSGDVLVSNDGTLAVPDVANIGITSSLGSGATVQLLGGGGSHAALAFVGTGTDSTNRSLLIGDARIEVANQNSTLVWSGPVDGITTGRESSLTKEGAGTLRLTGANGYLGMTQVNAGKLQILGSSALPNAGRVNVSTGAILEILTGTNETIGSLEGGGSLILGGQRLVTGGNDLSTTFSGLISGTSSSQLEKRGGGAFTLTNPNSTFSGGLTIAEGAVAVPFVANAGTNSPIGSNGPITLGDATHTGRLVINNTGTNDTNRPIVVSPGGGIIETSNANSEVVVAGSVSGTAALLKLGSGRLTLSGDKMFSGSLVVADGTLSLDGNVAGVPITVIDPGTLDSSSSVPRTIGALTFAGGHVSPGLPGETGAFNTGNIALSSGRFTVDLKSSIATGYDYLNSTGDVSFDGLVHLSIDLGYDPEDFVDVFRIIVNDGADPTVLIGENARFEYGGLRLDEGVQFWVENNSIRQLFEVRYGLNSVDNDVRLIAMPEPGTGFLMALGGLLLGLRRRR